MAHRRRAAVLLVVGVQDEQQVQDLARSSSISYGSAGTENIMLRKFAQYDSVFFG
jgi:hypothetical protein